MKSNTKDGKEKTTYEEAGVSIFNGNLLLEHIKPLAKATQKLYEDIKDLEAVFECETCETDMYFYRDRGFNYSLEAAIELMEGEGWKILKKPNHKGQGGYEYYCDDCVRSNKCPKESKSE